MRCQFTHLHGGSGSMAGFVMSAMSSTRMEGSVNLAAGRLAMWEQAG